MIYGRLQILYYILYNWQFIFLFPLFERYLCVQMLELYFVVCYYRYLKLDEQSYIIILAKVRRAEYPSFSIGFYKIAITTLYGYANYKETIAIWFRREFPF